MSVKVENVSIVNLVPNVSDALKKLLPTRLFASKISFDLVGVSGAVSNAIRRTISCELSVNRMYCEYSDLTTTDEFIIPEMVIKRLKMIPIDQKTPAGAVFELTATNPTNMERDVKAGEISTKGTLPFNSTFTLFTLKPGKSVKINNITLKPGHGYIAGEGMYTLGVNCSSIALDQVPINIYESVGIPSSVSDPRKWRVSFVSNGEMEPKKTVGYATDNICARLRSVQEVLYSISNNGNEYILDIPGETHTIGNLLMRTILDLFPNTPAVVYTCANMERRCTMRIITDDDISTVYKTTIKHLITMFTEIKDQIR